jgi:hypothetical protein
MATIVCEPATVLIKNYEGGAVTRHKVKLRNTGKVAAEVSVHGGSGEALGAAMFRVVGFPRQGAALTVVAGAEAVVEVEFHAPATSSKQPRCQSHTVVLDVAGGPDVVIPVRATPAPPPLFEAPPPRALEFGRVQLFSKPRRTYRFRCALPGKHCWRALCSGPAAAEFAFDPEEGTLSRGDALTMAVAWDAAKVGTAHCKLDIVVTTEVEGDGDGEARPVIRRFVFDVGGTAYDPNELPPPVAQPPVGQGNGTAAASIEGKRPKPKAKKRAPKDPKVMQLEAAFRKEIADADEQVA